MLAKETFGQTTEMSDKPILTVLKGIKPEQTPFWFMRQAGRYLPEYLALREKAGSFMELCFSKDFASEVTTQPLDRFNMDAAILFSDILTIPYALGQDVTFLAGEGPKLSPTVTPQTALAYQESDLDKLQPVYQTITDLSGKLGSDKTLIGFSGAPWTVATYMIEGGSSKDFSKVKSFAYSNPEAFEKLIDILVASISDHLIRQIKSGADVVQIFDSWSGVLPKAFFERWVIEPTKRIVQNIKEQYPTTPIIGFPKGAGLQLPDYVAKTGVTAISFDYATDPEWIEEVLPKNFPVQGNLDPSLLLCGGQIMLDEAKILMDVFKNRPHIFNLGHGVIKETPVEHVLELSQFIQKYRS